MTATNMTSVGDVVQLDPDHCEWGPLLMVVDKVYGWGVRCYQLVPQQKHGKAPRLYLRVNHDDYARIGRAEWIGADDASIADIID